MPVCNIVCRRHSSAIATCTGTTDGKVNINCKEEHQWWFGVTGHQATTRAPQVQFRARVGQHLLAARSTVSNKGTVCVPVSRWGGHTARMPNYPITYYKKLVDITEGWCNYRAAHCSRMRGRINLQQVWRSTGCTAHSHGATLARVTYEVTCQAGAWCCVPCPPCSPPPPPRRTC